MDNLLGRISCALLALRSLCDSWGMGSRVKLEGFRHRGTSGREVGDRWGSYGHLAGTRHGTDATWRRCPPSCTVAGSLEVDPSVYVRPLQHHKMLKDARSGRTACFGRPSRRSLSTEPTESPCRRCLPRRCIPREASSWQHYRLAAAVIGIWQRDMSLRLLGPINGGASFVAQQGKNEAQEKPGPSAASGRQGVRQGANYRLPRLSSHCVGCSLCSISVVGRAVIAVAWPIGFHAAPRGGGTSCNGTTAFSPPVKIGGWARTLPGPRPSLLSSSAELKVETTRHSACKPISWPGGVWAKKGAEVQGP